MQADMMSVCAGGTLRRLRLHRVVCTALVVAALSPPPAALAAERAHPRQDHNDVHPRCVHPYPCGDEWPAGLEGPFELKEVIQVRVESHDGVELEGWIGIPELPEGVRAPVLLHSSPYIGGCSVNPFWGFRCNRTLDPDWHHEDNPPWAAAWGGIRPIDFVRSGYAMAFFNLRGTGNSGGCSDGGGPAEQRDQAVLVEWLAGQPWSNGRVGMGGVSVPGTTPLQAAVENTPSLKTVIVSGIISDGYLFSHTPQGAAQSWDLAFAPFVTASDHVMPPLGGGPTAGDDPMHGTVEHAPLIPERLCPDSLARSAASGRAHFSDTRDPEFYESVRLIDRFPPVTTSVFLTHGFQDLYGHAFQESSAWEALRRAPKRMLEGQWGHSFPSPDPVWEGQTWKQILFEWVDFWLKGVGKPPRVGVVDYQDDSGEWRTTGAWPPPSSKEEALFLTGDELTPLPKSGSRSFRSIPSLGNQYRTSGYTGMPHRVWADVCEVADPQVPTSLVYIGGRLTEPAVIAGNPFAYLKLTSDQPGGIITLHVLDLGPDFDCETGAPRGLRVLSSGAADLRFHRGSYVGSDFPTAEPTHVRIDLVDLAARIEAGHRIAVVASFGELLHDYVGQPYYPTITVDGQGEDGSHVVLPLVEGTLGGSKTNLDYPPRPFVPGSPGSRGRA